MRINQTVIEAENQASRSVLELVPVIERLLMEFKGKMFKTDDSQTKKFKEQLNRYRNYKEGLRWHIHKTTHTDFVWLHLDQCETDQNTNTTHYAKREIHLGIVTENGFKWQLNRDEINRHSVEYNLKQLQDRVEQAQKMFNESQDIMSALQPIINENNPNKVYFE